MILDQDSQSLQLLENGSHITYQLLENDYVIVQIREEISGSNDTKEKIFFGNLKEFKDYFQLTEAQASTLGRKKHFSDLYKQRNIIS